MPTTEVTLAKGAEEEGETSSSGRQRVVSWAYPDWQQAPPLSIIHPKPPHYHDSLFNERPLRHDSDSFGEHAGYRNEKEDVVPDADALNVHLLVGVKSAEDTLRAYEIDVGFYYSEPDSSFELEADRSLCKLITDDAIAVGKERWAQSVQNLAGGDIDSLLQSRRDSGVQDLRSPTSSEFFDLTDSENSEHSVDSDPVPSTPKPRPYANVTVKQSSPTPLDYSPSRSLNASASLFVPTLTPVKFPSDFGPSSRFRRAVSSPSPSPSPTHSNFTFPSLNASTLPTLPPTLKKDEQGFYTEVTLSPSTEQTSTSNRAQRSSTSLLPPFLADPSRRTRKTSKTRKIVDQLRSASVNGFDTPTGRGCVPIRSISTPHQLSLIGPSLSISTDGGAHWLEDDVLQSPVDSLQSTTEDFEEEGDGWLRAEVEDADGNPEAKARRTRDLVQALGRNRPDSTHESDSDVNYRDTGWEIFTRPTDGPKKLSKAASSTRRKAPRQRSRKAHSGYRGPSASSPGAPPLMALPLSSLSPTQPFFPAFPIYNASFAYADSSYKFMQMPTQTHCFPSHAAYTGTPFGPITLFPPVLQLPTTVSMNMQGSITGGTGMRHTLW
ncbi:hypothetical protein PILCRDRAFT_785193 [Piloderma croceum F 1598]|uniref:Uncharacterized protein n=1 Tax=Piloderma croceum (strain F 1598) TaxID=765440 RepID=A0A0C3BYK2_PILCF|nr:hypothetical protein PILCRDRAFT_785193 [Piloderma croceum F 1598]